MSTQLVETKRRMRTYLFRWETIEMLEELAEEAGVSRTAYLEDLIRRTYNSGAR